MRVTAAALRVTTAAMRVTASPGRVKRVLNPHIEGEGEQLGDKGDRIEGPES